MRIKFKPSAIDRVKTTGRRFDVRFTCQAARGILLRAGASGSKSWAYWQTIPNSRKVYFKTFRRLELDSHNRVKPADLEVVLEWAAKQREAIREGISLKGADRISDKPETLKALFDEYDENHASLQNRLSTRQNNERIWRIHLEPDLGNTLGLILGLSDINRKDIKVVHDVAL